MYDAHANTVNIDDITTNTQNRKVLRRLRNNNAADFNEDLELHNLWINNDYEDENDYRPEGAEDLGWLGYFIGKSDYLQKLYANF